MHTPVALGIWVPSTSVDCIPSKNDIAAYQHTQNKAVVLRRSTRCLVLHDRIKRLLPPSRPLSPPPPM